MEEELNENELEERLYAMIHHVDRSQANVLPSNQNEGIQILEYAPRSTVRRYWQTNVDHNSPYQKINTSKDLNLTENIKNPPTTKNNPKPKEEKCITTVAQTTVDLSIFQSPIPQNIKKTIEILDHEIDNQVILESSDEDEVIEVALPPKPTITIESSDEDELHVVKEDSLIKSNTKQTKPTVGERESASPVPSVVSSVSDEFIRSDCIALNISSRHPDSHSFDFSLHGSDLDQSTPSKKKKKKRSKDVVTSTPEVVPTLEKTVTKEADECFATPKSKAKNKRQKNKFTVTEKSLPNVDIYDSDSNQSISESNQKSSYKVTETSLPSADVYESDSSQLENVKDISKTKSSDKKLDNSASDILHDQNHKNLCKNDSSQVVKVSDTISIDLTGNDSFLTLDHSSICESIVMGNVTGFTESEDYDDENVPQNNNNLSRFGSTKVPAILNEDLDFDNLKGKSKVCKRRRYSLTTLRAEMEKFYNESWGGENFNHREIQKNMSRDKSLWVIDPKDRMPSLAKRKVTCNYCNRPGHRDDTCRMKPPICYMCGLTGHFEPRCPSKICVNCGSPNQMYTKMCRNCCNWGSLNCAECGQNGHPSSHCPDIWRRYHNTITNNIPLERSNQTKKHFQLFCSGCTRRGHLVHTCRITIPFSGLPINSPYVCIYRSIYPATNDSESVLDAKVNKCIKPLHKNSSQDATPFRNDRNKRRSKSPTAHESHLNKRRNISGCEDSDSRNAKNTVNNGSQRKNPLSKDNVEDTNKNKNQPNKNTNNETIKANIEKAPNFIPICSTNHDNKGQIIQDNEVSDTSNVVTSSRIYVTTEIIDQLKAKEGEEWLKQTMEKYNVIVQNADVNSFLSIKGKIDDQEAFQSELRDWTNNQNKEIHKSNNEVDEESKNDQAILNNIPKNRNNLLRQLSKALDSLKEDIGDPKVIFNELNYLQNRHQQLLKQKIVSPKQLINNKGHINDTLKKLNMVLIGQAGLADGPNHVNELHSFQEKLMNSRQKVIPHELRKEIGQHYHSVFTAIPRNDYMELLKKYYVSKQSSAVLKRKKKEKSFKLSPKMNRLKKNFNSIPAQMNIKEKNFKGEIKAGNIGGHSVHKLVFYHKRLLKARPTNTAHKKMRNELVRKLHTLIGSSFRNENMSSKTMKKMRKAQDQAQMFLANV